MTWQVFVRAAAESDLERLNDGDQQTVASEMFTWVDQGPPRATPRDVLGVPMFDDKVAGGFRITYVVDDEHERILIVRIRKSMRTDRDSESQRHPLNPARPGSKRPQN